MRGNQPLTHRILNLLGIRILVLFCFILFGYPVSYANRNDTRTVDLKIAADEEFRNQSDWQLKAKRLISHSSQRFEKNFSIQFRIKKFVFWSSDNRAESMFELLQDLRKKIAHNDCDVVVGLTSQFKQRKQIKFSGIAAYLKSFVLVREMDSESSMERMITHEFCHLFGAADLHEKDSIMDEEKPGQNFDDFTKSLIFLNKQREFNPYVFPLSKQELEKVLSLYEARKSLDLEEENIGMLLAVFYLEKEDYPSMREECLDLVKQNPDSPQAHNLLGIALRRTGRIDEAIKEYKTALKLKENYPEAHYNLGRAYFMKGMNREAEYEFFQAIRLRPDYDKALCSLAGIHVIFGLIDQAVQECRSALEVNPNNPVAHFNLAHALYKKGSYKQAEKECLRSMDLGLRTPQSFSLLGILLEERGKRGEAKKQFQKALRLDPQFLEAHLNLANVYFKSKDFTKSEQHYQKVLELYPKNGSVCHYLALVYFYLEDYERSLTYVKKAEHLGVDVNPDFKKDLQKKIEEKKDFQLEAQDWLLDFY